MNFDSSIKQMLNGYPDYLRLKCCLKLLSSGGGELRTEVEKTHGANFAQITGKGVASLRDASGVSEKEILSFKIDDENDELKKIRCFAAIFLFSRIFLIPLR